VLNHRNQAITITAISPCMMFANRKLQLHHTGRTTGWPQKSKPQTFVHSPNNDWFSKLFHWHIQRKICNKVVTINTPPSYLCRPINILSTHSLLYTVYKESDNNYTAWRCLTSSHNNNTNFYYTVLLLSETKTWYNN